MEPGNHDDWAEILGVQTRLWAWATRMVRSLGWAAEFGEDEAATACVAAVHAAMAKWNSDETPPRAFVERAVMWEMSKRRRSLMCERVKHRPLTDRDAEELEAPDDTFRAVAARDELEVFRAWCGRQGRAGALLWRRVAGDPAEELARAYGLSASQVRRELARASQEARGRLDG